MLKRALPLVGLWLIGCGTPAFDRARWAGGDPAYRLAVRDQAASLARRLGTEERVLRDLGPPDERWTRTDLGERLRYEPDYAATVPRAAGALVYRAGTSTDPSQAWRHQVVVLLDGSDRVLYAGVDVELP